MAVKKGAELEKGAEAGVKVLELDERVKQIIDDEFSDFEKYMPTLQDVRMYQRKRKEYWQNIEAKIKGESANNGRTEETGSN